jgi:hypothetical protein
MGFSVAVPWPHNGVGWAADTAVRQEEPTASGDGTRRPDPETVRAAGRVDLCGGGLVDLAGIEPATS